MKRVIGKIITILVILFIGLEVFDLWHIWFSHKLEPKAYTPIEIQWEFKEKPNKVEVRKLVVGLYNTPHFYFERHINADGMTRIGLGLVIINPDVSPEMYGWVLAHELTHLKYRVGNESWVSFEAFKTLYESGNEVLKNSALYYADKVMSGWYDGAYNIGYYILEYLEAQNAL